MNRQKILLQAPVGTRSGYGAHSRDLALALIRSNKYDIQILPTPWGQTPNNALDAGDPNHVPIIQRLIYQQPNYVPDIFMQVTIPSEFHRKGKYNIGITAGIETTIPPGEWIVGANRMDLVIATSEHSKNILASAEFDAKDKQGNTSRIKLLKPVEVLFEGIDTNIYKKVASSPDNELKKTLSEIKEDFCFLFTGTWLQGHLGADRKDIGMLVKVFCDLFRMKLPRKRPALILKTSGAFNSIPDRVNIEKKLRQIFKAYGGKRPNVYLLHGDLTDAEINQLYNHPKVKAMVSFTHGEGFGRPLLEFTATGKPVIASGWSGQLDFLDPDKSVLLPGQLTEVHPSALNKWIVKGSKWFTVDYEKAAQYLYDMFHNYEKYHEVSKKQRTRTVKEFTLEKMQEKFISILDSYVGKPQTYIKPIEKPAAVSNIQLPKLKKIQSTV